MLTKKTLTYIATLISCMGLALLMVGSSNSFLSKTDVPLIIVGVVLFIASNFVKKK